MLLVTLSPSGGAAMLDQHGSRPVPTEAGGARLSLPLPAGRGGLTVSCIPFDRERLHPEQAFQRDAAPGAMVADLPLSYNFV